MVTIVEIIYIFDPVFNKQNDWGVTFGNDVSKHHRVSTNKHPASIMLLSVVSSNGMKMPLKPGYRLISVVYEKFWRRKFSKSQEGH